MHLEHFSLCFTNKVPKESLTKRRVGFSSNPHSSPKLPINMFTIYLSMKEGSLFCFVIMRSIELRILRIVFLVCLESS
jgi:hypothetical protein